VYQNKSPYIKEFCILLDDLLSGAEFGLKMIGFLENAKIKAGVLDDFEQTLQSIERQITTLTGHFQGDNNQENPVPAFRERFEFIRLGFLAIKKDFPGPLVQ
jgi:hypothetical protein